MILQKQAQAATRTATRAAFTLMEMLVVVAILVVLAGAAVPIYLNYLANARIDRAKADVVTLEKAVEAYAANHDGILPQSLQVLTQVDPQSGAKASLEVKHLEDPWRRPYVYEPQNLHPQTGRPRIYSQGPPGGQMIANW
jgi:general secretion pathway protein G